MNAENGARHEKSAIGCGKKEAVYYFVFNILTKVITYILLITFANLYSLVDYGQASFAIMTFTIASAIIFSGFSSVFVPFYVKRGDVSSMFYSSALATAVMAIATLIISLKYAIVWPFALCIIFALLTRSARAVMIAEYRYHLIQATEVLFVLSNFVFVILWRDLGDYGIVYALTASNFLVMLACVYYSRKQLWAIISKPRFDLRVVKTYIIKSFSAVALLVSSDVLGRADAVVLGFLSTFENVARYNISSSITGILTAISLAVSMFLLTRGAEVSGKKSSRIFLRSIRIAFSLNLLAAIALVSLIHPIMRLLFRQYVGSEFYVMLLAGSTLFYSLYYLYMTDLIAKLHPEKAFGSIVIAALANIGLDFVLIPSMGLLGICIAAIIAGGIAFRLAKIGLPVKAKVLIYLSPLLVAASYYLGVAGLVVAAPAVFLLLRAGLFEEGDWRVIKSVLKQTIRLG